MLPYDRRLKLRARSLRNRMTEAERALWKRLSGKQLRGVQFYRQKPIGNFIVDFFAPSAELVIEVDGARHFEAATIEMDTERTSSLNALGLRVLRFSNSQVLVEMESVLKAIDAALAFANPP